MAALKLAVLAVAMLACLCSAKEAPTYGKTPGTEESLPKYEFVYDVRDPKGGGRQGHLESHDGEAALGMYYVQLPDGNTQKVQYLADHWGYHPVVSYSRTSPHGSITSEFALGERAVNALRSGKGSLATVGSNTFKSLKATSFAAEGNPVLFSAAAPLTKSADSPKTGAAGTFSASPPAILPKPISSGSSGAKKHKLQATVGQPVSNLLVQLPQVTYQTSFDARGSGITYSQATAETAAPNLIGSQSGHYHFFSSGSSPTVQQVIQVAAEGEEYGSGNVIEASTPAPVGEPAPRVTSPTGSYDIGNYVTPAPVLLEESGQFYGEQVPAALPLVAQPPQYAPEAAQQAFSAGREDAGPPQEDAQTSGPEAYSDGTYVDGTGSGTSKDTHYNNENVVISSYVADTNAAVEFGAKIKAGNREKNNKAEPPPGPQTVQKEYSKFNEAQKLEEELKSSGTSRSPVTRSTMRPIVVADVDADQKVTGPTPKPTLTASPSEPAGSPYSTQNLVSPFSTQSFSTTHLNTASTSYRTTPIVVTPGHRTTPAFQHSVQTVTPSAVDDEVLITPKPEVLPAAVALVAAGEPGSKISATLPRVNAGFRRQLKNNKFGQRLNSLVEGALAATEAPYESVPPASPEAHPAPVTEKVAEAPTRTIVEIQKAIPYELKVEDNQAEQVPNQGQRFTSAPSGAGGGPVLVVDNALPSSAAPLELGGSQLLLATLLEEHRPGGDDRRPHIVYARPVQPPEPQPQPQPQLQPQPQPQPQPQQLQSDAFNPEILNQIQIASAQSLLQAIRLELEQEAKAQALAQAQQNSKDTDVPDLVGQEQPRQRPQPRPKPQPTYEDNTQTQYVQIPVPQGSYSQSIFQLQPTANIYNSPENTNQNIFEIAKEVHKSKNIAAGEYRGQKSAQREVHSGRKSPIHSLLETEVERQPKSQRQHLYSPGQAAEGGGGQIQSLQQQIQAGYNLYLNDIQRQVAQHQQYYGALSQQPLLVAPPGQPGPPAGEPLPKPAALIQLLEAETQSLGQASAQQAAAQSAKAAAEAVADGGKLSVVSAAQPVEVEKPVAVAQLVEVERPVAYPQPVPVPVPVPQPVQYAVPQLVAVPHYVQVPVKEYQPVYAPAKQPQALPLQYGQYGQYGQHGPGSYNFPRKDNLHHALLKQAGYGVGRYAAGSQRRPPATAATAAHGLPLHLRAPGPGRGRALAPHPHTHLHPHTHAHTHGHSHAHPHVHTHVRLHSNPHTHVLRRPPGALRNLYIEYGGFKPPLVPSQPIDEDPELLLHAEEKKGE